MNLKGEPMSEINDDVKIKVIDSDKLVKAINEGSYDINLSAVMALGAVILDTKKQEPISDSISRQAAVDAITSYNGVVDKSVAKRILIQLPSAQSEQRWIPCSERLPKVGTYVLVSKKSLGFRSNLPNVCTAHRSRDPRSGKEEWNDMLFGKLDDDDVLAWMPLPEPYRAERRTDETD